jgi:type I restriction-modification system DNA methylase subunit
VGIADDVLRDLYVRGKYRDVILPMTVLRRLDVGLEPTKQAVVNARIEHDRALLRVMTSVLQDDTQLFKEFMDNESFQRWLKDTVFGLTYEPAGVDA